MDIPDGQAVIEQATKHGWESGVVAFIVIAVLVMMCALLILQWRAQVARDKASQEREEKRDIENQAREQRLADRVTKLETLINTELVELVKDTTAQLSSTASQMSANISSNEKLSEALDSWRRYVEKNDDTLRDHLKTFGQGCQERWKEALENQLPEAIHKLFPDIDDFIKHMPAVLDKLNG